MSRIGLTTGVACVVMAAAVPAMTAAAGSGQSERELSEWVDLRHPAPHAELRAPGTLDPVDQAVGDLDALSHSLRRVDPGPARFPEHVRLYRLRPGSPGLWSQLGDPVREQMQRHDRHTYRYEAPGVRAWLRRPSYMVRGEPGETPIAFERAPQRDGEFIELIPADTVFDLIPPGQGAASPSDAVRDPQPGPDLRLDYRIDTRIDTRIEAIPSRGERGD